MIGLLIAVVGLVVMATVAFLPGIIITAIGSLTISAGRMRADERWLRDRRDSLGD